jgi:hypothetical protein
MLWVATLVVTRSLPQHKTHIVATYNSCNSPHLIFYKLASNMPQIVELRYIDPKKLEALLVEQFPAYPPSYRVEVNPAFQTV